MSMPGSFDNALVMFDNSIVNLRADMADPQTVETLARELRRIVNLMRSICEAQLAPLGLTAGMRALMEALAIEGPRTVPEIARARGVSRQHIQVIVNALADAGLARARANPAHKRSPQIALTPAGERLLAEVRGCEAPLWARLAAGFAEGDLRVAIEAARRAAAELEAMRAELPAGDGED
jgi:DNA-binding MarR family transcriptional regulator